LGLGYVGFPLAVAFSKRYPTLGFDVDAARIEELQKGRGSSLEVEPEELRRAAEKLTYTETVGVLLKAGDISSTSPRSIPVPRRRSASLSWSESPSSRSTGTSTSKVTSGSTPEVADFIDALYRSIIPAGTHKAGSIRVAEAAKVIENTQRDVNIALINELAVLGLAFKENCPDLRNTRVVDILRELGDYGISADVYDPWVDPRVAKEDYGITPIEDPQPGRYDAIVLAVAHRQFGEMEIERLRALGRPGAIFFDVKHLFPASVVDGRL